MQHGFSLLELLVVTALLGVLALAGWPGLQASMHQQRLLRVAEQLYGEVRDTRLAAIGGGEDWWFGMSQQGQWCYWQGEQQPHSCTVQQRAYASGLATQHVPAVVVEALFAHVPAARFTAFSGMAGFSSGHFRITHEALSNVELRVIVSSLGRIRLCTQRGRFSRVPPC